MNLPEPLQDSLKRLASALDQLEAASERRALADRVRSDLEEELAVMQDDRARLAVELDGALSRNRSLTLANEDVSKRLDRASEVIANLIDAGKPPASEDEDA